MADLFASLRQGASRALNDDALRGRFGFARGGKTGRATSGALGARLTKALHGRKMGSRPTVMRPFAADGRQRVVVKVSFRNHAAGGGGGGGGRLLAHAAYLERDGAAREGERGCFYDRAEDELDDAQDRLREWASEDKRHFRVMLAPESGARLIGEDGDLKGFTRDVMGRMERDLGVKLDWVAVDHHNTDNPHAHVILRGVRRDGVDLVLPREYVAHGLREAAREVATDLIGARSLADERLRLEREVEGRGFNRLDRAIAQELGEGREILVQTLGRGRGRDPEFANAMKARAQALARIGLAEEVRRNVFRFERDWRERLEAAKPLDVRRELARGRLYEPRMGRVAGKVLELGPRGENPDRAVLVIEAPERGRLLLNTSMAQIADLQRGSWVALEPDGKRAQVARLSFHGLDVQVPVGAETELDRELDRRARGAPAQLPACPEVEEALGKRAAALEANGYGVRSASGKFYFREGAREDLRRAELEREGDGRARGGAERELPREGEVWRVGEVKELFAGKAAVLERGRDVLVQPIGRDVEIAPGDQVAFKAMQGRAQDFTPERLQLELVKAPVRGLDLGR